MMLKKNWSVVFVILLLILLGLGYLSKDSLYNFISEKMKEQAGNEVELLIDNLYNYANNGKDFQNTLLEFSSTGCVICKQMEPVLDEIRNAKSAKINVVFLHIMKPENQDLMKYYGISAVPLQILLDKKGKEFFRHYGFISATELKAKCLEQETIKSIKE